jgi:hypothetical protein
VTEELSPSFHNAIKREVKAALAEASIFDIGSYGWLNHNDPDPEFIGHAMWQTDGPSIDDAALFGERAVRSRPKDIEREILTSGEDFWGLMEASRLSIGLALVWKRQARDNPINESAYFWLHHTDSFLKLAMASDRLRDLLIIACTGAPPKPYSKKNRHYVTPFENASDLIAKRGIDDHHLVGPLAALPAVAHALYRYRLRRNAIVHDVATRMAQFVGYTVLKLQQRYDQEQETGFRPESRKSIGGVSRAERRRGEIELEIDRATEDIKDWYWLLIRASNLVFQVEYWTRRFDAVQAST